MTVEADLTTALALLCPRVFPDVAPVATSRPYVTYQQIGGDPVNYQDNTAPDNENAEFQINVWADTRTDAKALIKQIEAGLRAASAFTARPTSKPISDFDNDMQRYGARQDFSVWSAA